MNTWYLSMMSPVRHQKNIDIKYKINADNVIVSGSDYINTGLFNKDIDYHELVDHNKIMKAFRFPKDGINCTEKLDENTFGTILNLSVTSTSTAESMAKAVLSMDNFNFNALVSTKGLEII